MAALADYIAAHYASPLQMTDLARHVHVSVRTLQNLFHGHCGEPPLRALRRYRLQQFHAAVIARPWSPLRQHYTSCGLTGSLADRDLFLEIYGLTVREHQESCRHKLAPASMPVLAERSVSEGSVLDLQAFRSRSA